MKTKVSKRILSVLLAALMIITSVPLTVFAFSIDADVDASKDPAVIEVTNAMTAYEEKMNGTVYTNMAVAYNAYVAAYQALDAYIYGEDSNALDGKAAALTSATDAMQTGWTAYTGTKVGSFAEDDNRVSADDYASVYKNLLYVKTGIGSNDAHTNGEESYTGKKLLTTYTMKMTTSLYYSDTTMLYDGKTAPQFGVMLGISNASINSGNVNQCRVNYAYVDAAKTPGIQFVENWHGQDQKLNFQWTYLDNSTNNCTITVDLNNCLNGMNGKYTANIMRLNSWPGTDTQVFKEITPEIIYNSGFDLASNDSRIQPATIRVLNYKLVTDTMDSNVSKLVNVSDYKQGGLADVINGFDKAMVDPNSFFTSSNDYQSCEANYTQAVNGMNSTSTKDNKAYDNLRTAMAAKMVAYNHGENSGLTDASYAELKTAYENAIAIITSGYSNPTGAQDAADVLNGLVLETAEQKVDATALAAVIDAFEAYDHIFTDDSYNNVANVVYTAKEVVWGAENKYGDPASLLTLSDENQEKVAQQTAAVEEAIKALRIDSDSVVSTEYGRYSLDNAIALVEALNPDDYSNCAEIQAVANKAKEYIAKCALTDLTDYTAQYNEYIAEIEKVIVAYNSRKTSFMAIPDGMAFNNTGSNYLTDMTRNDQGTVGVGFSYTNKAVVFRKTHDALNTKYGTATIKLISGIKTGSSTPLANNMLDSISINAGDDTKTGYINGYSGMSSKPPALTDDQKASYPGCLTYNANDNSVFALEKLSYSGRSGNNNCPRIITLQDGTEITDEETAYATDLTTILGTTDGVSSDPGRGGVFARSSNNDVAETYVNADMTFSLPATTPVALSASTTPIKATNYAMRTNFGAVVLRNVQNTTAVSGYERFTSAVTGDTGEKIYTQVEVIDISYLVDLITMCNGLLNDSAKYTDVSFNSFANALAKAQEDLEYTNPTVTTSTLVSRCQSRYTNLWDAYQALELKDLAVTFNYKNADGTDASTVIKVKYGASLSDYADEVNAIKTPQWTSADGAYKYTFKEWSPAFDVNAAIIIDTPFTAVYDSETNLADFIAYNNAKAALMGKLVDETYTTAALEAVNTAIQSMTYFTKTSDEQAVILGTEQDAINAETAQLVALAEGLTPSTVDITSAKALVEKAKAEAGIDEDVYNIGSLDFSYTSEVTVGGEKVIGLTFGSQDDVDAAVRAALNASNLNKRVYTIYLNGTAVGTAEYGSPVIVDSNGNFVKDVPDMDVDISEGAKMVAWSYSYAAPSRNDAKSEPKYMLTATSLGFIVKGDTYLTTANAAENEEGYVVKFTTNDGKIFDVQYTTDGTVTVPAAPNYAFYTFTGYEGGYQKGDVITVSSNMTITANYEADTRGSYTINFFPSYDSWDAGGEGTMVPGTYRYEELVELSAPNAYCFVSAWADPDNDYAYEFKLLAYGSSYSFLACQDLGDDENLTGIVALTKAEYDTILRSETLTESTILDGAGNEIKAIDEGYGQWVYPDPVATVSVLDEVVPVYNSDNQLAKFSMIGTFTLPEGYEIVEAGILFTSQQGSDLKVENVGKNGIARFKASRHTAGNQFVINVNAPSDGRVVSFDYAAYAIVKDDQGNLKTLYSKTVPGTTQGL